MYQPVVYFWPGLRIIAGKLERSANTSNNNRNGLIWESLSDNVVDMRKVILVVVGHFFREI